MNSDSLINGTGCEAKVHCHKTSKFELNDALSKAAAAKPKQSRAYHFRIHSNTPQQHVSALQRMATLGPETPVHVHSFQRTFWSKCRFGLKEN